MRRSLSADAQRDINSLFVKIGKIGEFVRSGLWVLELKELYLIKYIQ